VRNELDEAEILAIKVFAQLAVGPLQDGGDGRVVGGEARFPDELGIEGSFGGADELLGVG